MPKPPKVSIRTIPGRKKPYCVYHYENRKPLYHGYYATKKEAEAEQRRQTRKLKNSVRGPLLDWQEKEYREADDLAREYGMTVLQAVRSGIGSRMDGPGRWPEFIEDHREPFLDYCRNKKKLTVRTIEFYNEKLGILFEGLREVLKKKKVRFGDVEVGVLKKAIQAADWGPSGEKMIKRSASVFWNWGHKLDEPICPPSFTRFLSLDHPKTSPHEDYYTNTEVAALLYDSMGRWDQDVMAIRFFTGMRTEEVERLPTNLVDPQEKTIHMIKENSKTAGLMQNMPDVLWEWLPKEFTRKRFSEFKMEGQLPRAKARVGLNFGKTGKATTRRTFVTNHLVAFENEALTKSIARHEDDSEMTLKHYKGSVTYREGKPHIPTKKKCLQFFRLTPSLVARYGRWREYFESKSPQVAQHDLKQF